VYNKIDVTSPVRKFQNPIRNCFNSSASAEAANAFSVWKRKKDVEILNALREAEENVFWIDDENDDDDFFVSALSISNPDFPDLEETKQTPSFLRLLELFEVLLVEEEAAILHELLEELFLHDDDKANMMMSKKKRVPESCSKNACCC
jgi:hypothetical protein